jgi:hypothetical protein
MSDPTEKDLTAAQIRDHELALQVPGLLAQWQDATRELHAARREIMVRDDDAVRLRAALDAVTLERDEARAGKYRGWCLFCGIGLDDLAASADHAAGCSRHPAVAEIARLRALLARLVEWHNNDDMSLIPAWAEAEKEVQG